jgi:hypothetical protein
LKKLSLGVAASVCARLLEKRFASVENAPEIVAFVAEKCLVLLKTHSPEGYPALRMAADITCRLIETKRLSNKEAAARNIRENLETLESVARTIPAEDRKDVLKPAVDMVLKLLETVTLSTTSVSPVIKKMAEKTKAFLDGGE